MTNTPAKTPLQVLTRTRKILDDPERWIKGEWANELEGSRKICYCLDGALIAAADGAGHVAAYERMMLGGHIREENSEAYLGAAEILRKVIDPPPIQDRWETRDIITQFNDSDGRVHEQVIEVLDEAIAEARR